MARFKLFGKALLGYLGFTAVQQVSINLDPVTFTLVHNIKRLNYARNRRQRDIDQGYRRIVAADEVELHRGTITVPVTLCSPTVPVYRDIYINFDVLFAGSDAELRDIQQDRGVEFAICYDHDIHLACTMAGSMPGNPD
ncbi:MAG: hypothetical protein Q9182_004514 [Xanthomendoza sp. 2 TL-2023]